MKSWRLAWAVSEVTRPSNFVRHHRALRGSWKYWLALALKFVPHVWPFPIRLQLREGGAFVVRKFMTLFIYEEIFVDRCYDLPFELSRPPVIVDVGSNTGLFILRMKQLYPRATVVGFEPLPDNFAQLRANIAASGLQSVSVFDCGVGGRSRTETLHIHPRNLGGNSIIASEAMDGRTLPIDIIDVEQMLAKTPYGQCDLLKLDCEGAELEIMQAITPEIAARIGTIVFEPTPALYDVHDIARHLESVGYTVSKNRGLWMAVHA
jgi:FkbM family methyltransferase